MSIITIFDNSTGKFNDIDLFFYSDHFSILGYHFTKTNTLKERIQLFNHSIDNKNITIELRKINGKSFLRMRDVKTHVSFEHIKHIKVETFDNHFLVIFYI